MLLCRSHEHTVESSSGLCRCASAPLTPRAHQDAAAAGARAAARAGSAAGLAPAEAASCSVVRSGSHCYKCGPNEAGRAAALAAGLVVAENWIGEAPCAFLVSLRSGLFARRLRRRLRLSHGVWEWPKVRGCRASQPSWSECDV